MPPHIAFKFLESVNLIFLGDGGHTQQCLGLLLVLHLMIIPWCFWVLTEFISLAPREQFVCLDGISSQKYKVKEQTQLLYQLIMETEDKCQNIVIK